MLIWQAAADGRAHLSRPAEEMLHYRRHHHCGITDSRCHCARAFQSERRIKCCLNNTNLSLSLLDDVDKGITTLFVLSVLCEPTDRLLCGALCVRARLSKCDSIARHALIFQSACRSSARPFPNFPNEVILQRY